MLTQTQTEMRTNVRKFANVQGNTALLRHPDADINDYINRALGSLHRRLTAALPDQRILSSTTITTAAGTSTYALPSTFDHLISAELTVSGAKTWLQAYEMSERPVLTSQDSTAVSMGVPFAYRLRASNIELLPTPQSDEYTVLLWYVPAASQLASGAATYDTISRLDDYVVAYASRFIAIKDKNWDLRDACKEILGELTPEIEALARNRDRNSPPRVIDVYQTDRWGRARRFR